MSNHNNAKYAFYYLLSLAALFFMSLSVGMIVFSVIDKSIADVLVNYSENVNGPLKFGISALLIAAPIFYLLSKLINSGLKKGDLDKESGIRRWLTYFILLISALILLGVFIGVINNFLSGELTSRFVLKALSVFLIAGVIFSYYLYEVKRDDFSSRNLVIKGFFFGSLVLVVAAFVSAWFFVESPKVARDRRLDQNVVNNIYALENAVNTYATNHGKLPDDLNQVKNEPGIFLNDKILIDPETRAAIEYQKISTSTFQFCADFRTDSRDQSGNYSSPDSKVHAIGHQCLKGTVLDVTIFRGVSPKVVPAQAVQ